MSVCQSDVISFVIIYQNLVVLSIKTLKLVICVVSDTILYDLTKILSELIPKIGIFRCDSISSLHPYLELMYFLLLTGTSIPQEFQKLKTENTLILKTSKTVYWIGVRPPWHWKWWEGWEVSLVFESDFLSIW